MSLKRWVMRKPVKNSAELVENYIHPVLMDVLCARNLQEGQIREYLEDGGLESPFVLKDMDLAVERIQTALESQEKIAVYGDYDCDGITSTVILVTYLQMMGADVQYHIPEREDGGYGLCVSSIDSLHADGVNLIITVDNGISAIRESGYISELDMDLIITDHHTPGDTLPEAVAIVNPHRKDCPSEFKHLAGVGVALKLIAALENDDYDNALQFAGDLAAIGTIGDVMPLIGENRALVKHGLELLKFSENIGLNALLDAAQISRDKINSGTVAYGIVPRINAAGRFSMANKVIELLLCEDEQIASELAQEINGLNSKRQQLEQDILRDIYEEIGKNPHKIYQRVLVFAKEGWPQGVLGIASAKLTERFGKPSVLFSLKDGQAVGSARSVEGFSIYDALYANKDLMTKWGGHSLAAGMTLSASDIPALDQGLNEYAARSAGRMPEPCVYIDRQISPDEISLELVEALSVLEPCGNANPSPIFLIREAKLEEIIPLSGGAHLKLKFSCGGRALYGLLFGVAQQQFYYRQGAVLDLLVTLEINRFNGVSSVSVKIKELRPHSFEQNKYFNAKLAWEKAMRGEPIDAKLRGKLIPDRKDFAAVYLYLKKTQVFGGSIEQLYLAVQDEGLNYGKLAVIVEVLQEHGLIECSADGAQISVCPVQDKVDIFDSEILHNLKQG